MLNWLGDDEWLLHICQVNYLHSHGLAHTELRLENVHVSPVDRHIKVSTVLSVQIWLCFFLFLGFSFTDRYKERISL